MSFVRSGFVYSGNGAARYTGMSGLYWSAYALPNSSERAYFLNHNAGAYPAFQNERIYGFTNQLISMSFVRSGYVYTETSSLRNAGDYSYYWSSYAYPGSSQLAYYLDFNTASVYPAGRDGRVSGFSAWNIDIISCPLCVVVAWFSRTLAYWSFGSFS